jgi:hypothetical protein
MPLWQFLPGILALSLFAMVVAVTTYEFVDSAVNGETLCESEARRSEEYGNSVMEAARVQCEIYEGWRWPPGR